MCARGWSTSLMARETNGHLWGSTGRRTEAAPRRHTTKAPAASAGSVDRRSGFEVCIGQETWCSNSDFDNPAQSGISGQDQDTIRLCRKSLRDAVAQFFHAVSTLARQTEICLWTGISLCLSMRICAPSSIRFWIALVEGIGRDCTTARFSV